METGQTVPGGGDMGSDGSLGRTEEGHVTLYWGPHRGFSEKVRSKQVLEGEKQE